MHEIPSTKGRSPALAGFPFERLVSDAAGGTPVQTTVDTFRRRQGKKEEGRNRKPTQPKPAFSNNPLAAALKSEASRLFYPWISESPY
ncbi:MAG: hypothetical protein IME96_04580 [Proteobacteria bacterium]|nr:hypothetical protein [Pseudomonadota bacterium]